MNYKLPTIPNAPTLGNQQLSASPTFMQILTYPPVYMATGGFALGLGASFYMYNQQKYRPYSWMWFGLALLGEGLGWVAGNKLAK